MDSGTLKPQLILYYSSDHRATLASGRWHYPNPMHERGTTPQVSRLRFGLGLVVFTLPLALPSTSESNCVTIYSCYRLRWFSWESDLP